MPAESVISLTSRKTAAAIGLVGDKFDEAVTRVCPGRRHTVTVGASPIMSRLPEGGRLARALLDSQGVGRRADAAGDVDRRGRQEHLVPSVTTARQGQVFEPPEFAERHAELADQD